MSWMRNSGFLSVGEYHGDDPVTRRRVAAPLLSDGVLDGIVATEDECESLDEPSAVGDDVEGCCDLNCAEVGMNDRGVLAAQAHPSLFETIGLHDVNDIPECVLIEVRIVGAELLWELDVGDTECVDEELLFV